MKFFDLPHFVSETRVKERFDEISLGDEKLEFACSMTMSYVLLITDLRVILLDNKKLSFKSAPILRAEILDFEIVEKKKSNFQTLVIDGKDSNIIATFESNEASQIAKAILEGSSIDSYSANLDGSNNKLTQGSNADISKTLRRPKQLNVSLDSDSSPQSWIEENAIELFGLESFTSQNYLISDNSWINVETSEIFVSNFFPENCDACNVGGIAMRTCSACKRNPMNMLNCMTANADGDYLIFEIENDDEEGFPLGTFISFALNEETKVAPVVIGNIKIDKDDYLFFGERFASADSADFVTGIQVDGDQTIIAWIGISPLDGQITPLALTTSNAELTKHLLGKDVQISDPPLEIKRSVQESLNGLNAARMSSDAQAIANLNAEIVSQYYGKDDASAQSWAQSWTYQVWVEESFDEFVNELFGKDNDRDLEELIYVVDLLRIRGKVQTCKKLFDLIVEKREKDLTPGQLAFIDKSKESSAGAFLPSHFYALL